MKALLKNVLYFIFIYSMFSCSSSKKLAFNSAYKFSNYTYQTYKSVQLEDTTSERPVVLLTASANIEVDETTDNSFSVTNSNIYDKIGLSSTEGRSMDLRELKQTISELSYKEKRDIRKELKKEARQYRKEFEDTEAVMDTDRVNEISELLRWSIIFGSVGLVLLILGAIFTGILTFFGTIFVIGAAVLFILDQI